MSTIPLPEKTLQTLAAAHQRVLAAEEAQRVAVQQRGALVTVLFEAHGVPPETRVDFERGVLVVPDAPEAPAAA